MSAFSYMVSSMPVEYRAFETLSQMLKMDNKQRRTTAVLD